MLNTEAEDVSGSHMRSGVFAAFRQALADALTNLAVAIRSPHEQTKSSPHPRPAAGAPFPALECAVPGTGKQKASAEAGLSCALTWPRSCALCAR